MRNKKFFDDSILDNNENDDFSDFSDFDQSVFGEEDLDPEDLKKKVKNGNKNGFVIFFLLIPKKKNDTN